MERTKFHVLVPDTFVLPLYVTITAFSVSQLIASAERNWREIDDHVVTVTGNVRVTTYVSEMWQPEREDHSIAIFGSALYHSLREHAGNAFRFGTMAAFSGELTVRGTAVVSTGLRAFPVALHGIQEYSFTDGENVASVAIEGPLIDKKTIEVIDEQWFHSVVRWPDRPADPMLMVDIGTLWRLEQLVNQFALSDAAQNVKDLGSPEQRVNEAVNLLWNRFKDGLDGHGLWSPAQPPTDGI